MTLKPMSADRDATSRTLLERVRDTSDGDAWERFYSLYAPLLERFASTHGLSRQDAEDVRDDSLALVVSKLPTFGYDPSRGGFRGWLFRIARGKVIDCKRRRHERRADSVELLLVSDPAESPSETWERLWREEHLRFALRKLSERVSERTYQTFALLLLEDITVAEVCERMGMNSNQVYKAKARALASVREILARLGVEPPA